MRGSDEARDASARQAPAQAWYWIPPSPECRIWKSQKILRWPMPSALRGADPHSGLVICPAAAGSRSAPQKTARRPRPLFRRRSQEASLARISAWMSSPTRTSGRRCPFRGHVEGAGNRYDRSSCGTPGGFESGAERRGAHSCIQHAPRQLNRRSQRTIHDWMKRSVAFEHEASCARDRHVARVHGFALSHVVG